MNTHNSKHPALPSQMERVQRVGQNVESRVHFPNNLLEECYTWMWWWNWKMSVNVDWAQDLIAQKADRTELSELMSNARSNAAQVQVMVDILIYFLEHNFSKAFCMVKGLLNSSCCIHELLVVPRNFTSLVTMLFPWQSLGDLCNELKEKLNNLGSSVTALVNIRTTL